MTAATKHCARCDQDKGPTAFWSDPSKPDGRDATCRACRSATRKARRTRLQTPPDPCAGWCLNCRDGRHGRSCTAAFFGPDCVCGCGVLGYRSGQFDPTAPGPAELARWVA